jgi:hypothetical protein
VPIWERSMPSTPNRERPAVAAAQPKAPLQLKTFALSPSLGSLPGELAAGVGGACSLEGMGRCQSLLH